MKVKRKLGMGLKKRRKITTKNNGIPSFGSIVRKAKSVVGGVKEKDIQDDSFLPRKVQNALKMIRSRKGVREMSKTRIIPIPQTGGMLPLIPGITGISKIGAIAGEVGAIVNSIRDIVNLKKAVRNGQQRQVGNGIFLAPYRKGYGLYLSPPYLKN